MASKTLLVQQARFRISFRATTDRASDGKGGSGAGPIVVKDHRTDESHAGAPSSRSFDIHPIGSPLLKMCATIALSYHTLEERRQFACKTMATIKCWL